MNIADFHFLRPYWLLGLLPFAAVLFASLRRHLSQGYWPTVCDAELLPYLLIDKSSNQSRWSSWILSLGVFLAIVAMAGPTWDRLPTPVFRNASAMAIALDLSTSMNAEDVKPSRLIRARYKIADLLRQRKDGQTALLVFSGDAFTVTPLTNDTETIASQLDALSPNLMPSKGRNTAAVLRLAGDLFKQAGLRQGRIVLITDDVDLQATLPIIKSLDSVSVSVLAIGTEEGAPIPLPEGGGFVKDVQGSIVVPKLNGTDLAKLASAARGRFQTVTIDDSDIRNLLAAPDLSERQTDDERRDDPLTFELWDDKGPWLLLLVLPLVALSFRKGLLVLAILTMLPFPKVGYALSWQDLWQTKDQQATKAYQQGRYDDAAKLFENPDWKAAAQYKTEISDPGEMRTPKTSTGHYNQGNVLAKSGRLQEAIAAYDQALALDPSNVDAKYNKDLVENELEQQKQQQQRQQQDQQNQQQSKKDQSSTKSAEDQQQSGDSSQQQNQNGENKPEQKPETSEESRQQSENKDESSSESRQEQAKREPIDEQNRQAESEHDQQGESAKKNESKEGTNQSRPANEQLQANEQWLNRIPDDPAGLLRRKFAYQYSQRKSRSP